MEYEQVSAFEAAKAACIQLMNSRFNFVDSAGNRICAWEKPLNELGDKLQITIVDAMLTRSEAAENDAIKFEVYIVVEGALKIEVIKHDLRCDSIDERLNNLEAMALGMVGQFRHNSKLGIQHNEHSPTC